MMPGLGGEAVARRLTKVVIEELVGAAEKTPCEARHPAHEAEDGSDERSEGGDPCRVHSL